MFIRFLLAVLAIALPNAASIAAQTPSQSRHIELTIQVDARAAIGTQQRWMQALAQVGADRVVVKTGSAKSPSIEEDRLSSSTVVIVTGIADGNRLKLPGKSFAITDKSGIRAFLEELRADGAEVTLAEKKAFGLTSKQLVSLHETLQTPVSVSTRGANAGQVFSKIANNLNSNFTLDTAAKRALAGDETIAEELHGLSSGTVLAAIIRPLGLVLQPQRPQGGTVEIRVVKTESAKDNWPVGWPINRPPVQIAPKMFERLELEIRGFPLTDVMNAIQKRTGMPFLYDHNALAREGIELSETKVTLVREKVSYMVAVGKLLNQTRPRLIEELRVDENGKPFLWITTR